MSKTLKVDVIGIGGISRTHMPGWTASDDAEVTAGSDINEKALQDWGLMHGVTKLATDPAELFSDPDIDVIDSSNFETRQLVNSTLKITKDTMEPHALECVAFARALAEGAPSPVPPEQSLQVMTILDGIYRSQKEGGEVRI